MIEVEIDKDSGFCFGVVTAIESAERELGNTDTLYCLGDIVHNSLEVERLEHMGLHTIDHEGLFKVERPEGVAPGAWRAAFYLCFSEAKQYHDYRRYLPGCLAFAAQDP